MLVAVWIMRAVLPCLLHKDSTTVVVLLVNKYQSTVNLSLVVEPRSQLSSDLTGEEVNLTTRPALGKEVLKR